MVAKNTTNLWDRKFKSANNTEVAFVKWADLLPDTTGFLVPRNTYSDTHFINEKIQIYYYVIEGETQ